MKLHDLNSRLLDTEIDHDFRAVQSRPVPFGDRTEPAGDLPLAHALRALFALFGDQQNVTQRRS